MLPVAMVFALYTELFPRSLWQLFWCSEWNKTLCAFCKSTSGTKFEMHQH